MIRNEGEIPIGFLTVPFADWDLEKVADFAQLQGFRALEVAAWPSVTSRTEGEAAYVANHLGDLTDFSQAKADEIREIVDGRGLKISSLAYYENMMAADEGARAFYHGHLKNVIDAARKMGVPLVGTFPGRNEKMTVIESIELYGKVFPELVAYAGDNGVRIMFEPCPMEALLKGLRIGSIAYCPANWRKIIEATPEIGLNMDPSHLLWEGIDYERAVRDFAKYIVHAHAKDVKLKDHYETGIPLVVSEEPVEGWGLGLYTHEIPGQGNVDWKRFTDALREIGYNGVLSVELEAERYKPREDPVESAIGIATARQNLLPYCQALAA